MTDMHSSNGVMLTVILPAGKGRALLHYLHHEKAITTAVLFHARGTSEHSGGLGWALDSSLEKDILKVSVTSELADPLFEELYIQGEIHHPHGGIIYMEALNRMSRFTLPELPTEDQ